MAQVHGQRQGQNAGQLAAEQHLLQVVGSSAALHVADEVALQGALVVAQVQDH
ncbi:hypothetical protein D9M71_735530 [compost metagenome]